MKVQLQGWGWGVGWRAVYIRVEKEKVHLLGWGWGGVRVAGEGLRVEKVHLLGGGWV